jgi:hypothetical protein
MTTAFLKTGAAMGSPYKKYHIVKYSCVFWTNGVPRIHKDTPCQDNNCVVAAVFNLLLLMECFCFRKMPVETGGESFVSAGNRL